MNTTTIRTTTTHDSQIASIAGLALAAIGSQTLLSQGRCVDVLLDLYLATDDVGLKWTIAERLDAIRHLTAVLGDDMRADLEAIIEIVSIGDSIGLGCVDRFIDSTRIRPAARQAA